MARARKKDAEQNDLGLALRNCERRYAELLQAVTDYTYTVTIVNGLAVNTVHSPACLGVTGFSSAEYAADPFLWLNMIHEEDRDSVLQQTSAILAGQESAALEHRIRHKDGSIRWIQNTVVRRYDTHQQIIAYDGLICDITEKKNAEKKKETLILELREALAKVKLLSGFLPICASCKKIRDDTGYWNQIESYIRARSEVEFSHSICPDCAKRLYPEEYAAIYPDGK